MYIMRIEFCAYTHACSECITRVGDLEWDLIQEYPTASIEGVGSMYAICEYEL